MRNILQYRIFGKTIRFYLEKYGGSLLSIIIFCIFFLWIKPEYSTYKELIKEFPTLGMCAFGFLLTFLGIILQGDSETINWFRSRTILYKRFIKSNKNIVVMSLILSLYCYIIGYIDFKFNVELYSECIKIYELFTVSLFISLAIKFIVDFWIFIRVFYLLIKKD